MRLCDVGDLLDATSSVTAETTCVYLILTLKRPDSPDTGPNTAYESMRGRSSSFAQHFNQTMATFEAFLKNESTRNLRSLLKVVILVTIAAAAVASRLFSVIRKLLAVSWAILGLDS